MNGDPAGTNWAGSAAMDRVVLGGAVATATRCTSSGSEFDGGSER